jgi:hypothetical protein
MMRRAARRDENERGIIFALEQVGATVHQVDAQDFPDLVVGYRGQTFLIEVIGDEKDKKFRQNGGLSDGQAKWHRRWKGHAAAARTQTQALRVIGAID